MNQSIEPNNTNEVDLSVLFKKIWREKWILVALMIFTGTVAVYLAKTNQPYQAKVSIRPILNQATLPFQEVHRLISKEQFNPSPQTLLAQFLDALQYSDIVQEALASSKVTQHLPADKKDLINKHFHQGISILPPHRKPQTTNEEHAYLQSTLPPSLSPSEVSASILIESIIDDVNQRVIAEILVQLEHIYAFKNREYSQRILSTQQELESAVQQFRQEQQARIAFLAEQAAIARSVGRPSGSLLYGAHLEGTVIGISEAPPFHFRGYKAIEEELKEIKNRDAKHPELHSKEIRNLQIKLQDLQKQLDLKILDESIQYLKANIKAFKVVRIDLSDLSYSQRINSWKALLMGLFLGLFLGLLIIITRIILASPESSKAS